VFIIPSRHGMDFQWVQTAWNWFNKHLDLYPENAEHWHEQCILAFVEDNQAGIPQDIRDKGTILIR
jgi:hypothetical protein